MAMRLSDKQALFTQLISKLIIAVPIVYPHLRFRDSEAYVQLGTTTRSPKSLHHDRLARDLILRS